MKEVEDLLIMISLSGQNMPRSGNCEAPLFYDASFVVVVAAVVAVAVAAVSLADVVVVAFVLFHSKRQKLTFPKR